MFGERTLAALAALLLLFAGVSPAIGATVVDAGGPTVADHDGYEDDEYEDDEDDERAEPADEAYVDGEDVVLVYQYEEDGGNTTGHVATNVSEGLAYLTATDDALSNVTGNATIVAEPDRLDANGTFSAPVPGDLVALDATVEQRVTDATAESTVDLSAELSGTDEESDFEAMRTSGFVESAAESVTANGSVTVRTSGESESRRHHVVVTEGQDSYRIDFDESYAPESPEQFESRESALQTLQERFCGGMENNAFVSCSVSLDGYAFTDSGTPRVELDYTVTYEGLESTIENMGPMVLSSADNVSMTEASRIVDRVTNVTVDRIAATVDVSDGTTTVTWNASVSGTDDLALAYADLLEILGQMRQGRAMAAGPMATPMAGPFGRSPNETAERIRDRTLAKRAADMTTTMTWNASVEATDDGGIFEVSAASTAENWGAYLDELRARDGVVPPRTNVTVEAGIEGGRVVAEAVAHVRKDGLFAGQFDSMDRTTARMDEEARRFTQLVNAVGNASFQRARADVTADGGSVTVEAAVAAENAAALTAPLPKNLSAVESTYTDLETGTTYVRLDGVVDSNATRADVRSLALVGQNTTIAFEDPAEPTMDVPYVRSYLGLNGSASNGFPTVMVAGGAVAVTAAAGGGLLLLRS